MSASVVDQPRLSRTAPCASSGPKPMASTTCDGWTLPEEQAEPDDTAIPARSKPITAVSARSPGTANKTVFGNRCTSSENTTAPGVCSQAALQPGPQRSPRDRQSRSRSASAALDGRAKAGDPGDVLGPGPPALFLTAAAQQRLQVLDPLGQHQRADALGTADLVRRQRQQVGAVDLRSNGILPSAWMASTCSRPPAAWTISAASATGWIAPVSLLASMIETSAGGRAHRAAHAGDRDRPRPNGVTPTIWIASVENRPPASTEACSIAETMSRSTAGPLPRLQTRRKRERIRFRSARGEDDVLRLGADGRGNRGARILDQPPRLAALGMDRRRIAAESQSARHRRPRLGAQRRGRVPVEIDALGHGSHIARSRDLRYGRRAEC